MPASPMQQRLERGEPMTPFAHESAPKIEDLALGYAALADDVEHATQTLARAHAHAVERREQRASPPSSQP